MAGKNTLTFEFASTLNGTTGGYRVEGLEVIVPKAASSASSASSTPSAPQGQSFGNLPLRLFNQPVGTKRSTVFSLADISQPARLTISANDIDAAQEAKLYLNGKQIGLPQGIVEKNGGILTDSLTLAPNLLRQGENTLTFELGTNPNGSSGYSITALAIA
ncbi:MAG: hypothetical protein HC890_13940 [Chloroflexaceae bacterium]|nr:hypothetical protein [Chloroflexaceae bacterium]